MLKGSFCVAESTLMYRSGTAKSSFGVKKSYNANFKSGSFSGPKRVASGKPYGSPKPFNSDRPYNPSKSTGSARPQTPSKSYGFDRPYSSSKPFGAARPQSSSGRSFSSSRSQGSGRPQNGGGRPSRRPRGEHIDVGRYINRSVPLSLVSTYKAVNTFKDFGFSADLQTNLDKREYSQPTPIQDQAIRPIMEGRDLIGLANTGTGKTAAFLLPLIEKVLKNRFEKVLIIAPTRELAIQIDTELHAFTPNMRLYSAVCVGGTPMGKQIINIRRNPNFVIGTPGRLKDLSERGLIRFNNFQNIVLDEVDRMLDMGFVEEISNILNTLAEKRQALFFSATLPIKIKTLVKQFLNEPVVVEVKTGDTAANVLQDVVRVTDKADKFDKLLELLKQADMTKVLIFNETKWEVEKLTENLIKNGHLAESIHGNKRQNQREKSLAAFRNDRCRILVATDVAARGLDIGDISHVINYTVPQTYDDYVHRIGRTGRGDKSGMALTFVE